MPLIILHKTVTIERLLEMIKMIKQIVNKSYATGSNPVGVATGISHKSLGNCRSRLSSKITFFRFTPVFDCLCLFNSTKLYTLNFNNAIRRGSDQ